MLVDGVNGDMKFVSAKYELIIQLFLALIIAFSGTKIISLYGFFGVCEIVIWQQYMVTILMITGVVNAFNLMNGIDGLIEGSSLLGFLILFFTAIFFNDYKLAFSSILFIGFILITEAIKFL